MCGIAGVVGYGAVKDASCVGTMLSHMVHRGPDQHGVWQTPDTANAPGVVLGHRRLSILDLSEAGRQPMVHRDTGHVLVYNGECYNYLEIRGELEALGHKFESNSDTEVILDALVTWGKSAIDKLRGMFAMAFWNPEDGSTLFVRDRLGIKPLYYACTDSRLIFASEMRAILASERVSKQIDTAALDAYLWHGFVPGPRTMVRHVSLLPAGSMLCIDAAGRPGRIEKYWSLPKAVPAADQDAARYEALQELERAVHMRLISDVPLGVFLSGGVDSSTIATLAQRTSSAPVRSFNICFDEAAYDESAHARRVAQRLGTDHEEVRLTERYFLAGLDDALNALDQPTFDGINTFFVSRVVRDAGLTVALSGAGGDELCGGYSSFVDIPKAALMASAAKVLPESARKFIGAGASRILAGHGGEIPPQTRYGKLTDVLASNGNLISLYQASYALFTRSFHSKLRAGEAGDRIAWGLYPELRREYEGLIEGSDELAAITQLELSSFVGQRLLRDTDTASMAVSLEVRVPLLDHKFVEKLACVDSHRRYQPLGSKSLLRAAMQPDLPESYFERPKAGFELPMEIWCRRALSSEMESTFSDLTLINRIGLNCETVQRTWRAFKKGGTGLYWSRVWSLYVLIHWCRKHEVYL